LNELQFKKVEVQKLEQSVAANENKFNLKIAEVAKSALEKDEQIEQLNQKIKTL